MAKGASHFYCNRREQGVSVKANREDAIEASIDAARLVIGDVPRVQVLKTIGLEPDPIATLYMPEVTGVLDDHFESWFCSYEKPPTTPPEGLESVVNLGESQQWLPPPSAPVSGVTRQLAEARA